MEPGQEAVRLCNELQMWGRRRAAPKQVGDTNPQSASPLCRGRAGTSFIASDL